MDRMCEESQKESALDHQHLLSRSPTTEDNNSQNKFKITDTNNKFSSTYQVLETDTWEPPVESVVVQNFDSGAKSSSSDNNNHSSRATTKVPTLPAPDAVIVSSPIDTTAAFPHGLSYSGE